MIPQAVTSLLLSASPQPVPRSPHQQGAAFIQALYAENEMLSVVTAARPDAKGKLQPTGFGRIFTAYQLAAALAANLVTGDGGVWYRPAPVVWPETGPATRGVTDQDCLPRFLLLEIETATVTNVAAVLGLGLPIVAAYSSGGESIHCLMRLDVCACDWRSAAQIVLRSLAPLGVDPVNINPSRLSRLPGCRRGDALQTLLYLAPDAA